jgi:hypothetical protein
MHWAARSPDKSKRYRLFPRYRCTSRWTTGPRALGCTTKPHPQRSAEVKGTELSSLGDVQLATKTAPSVSHVCLKHVPAPPYR